MIDVCITLESTCDLEKEFIEKYDLTIIDMMFEVDGKTFNTKTDSVVSSRLYEKMLQKKKTATSQINDYVYEENFVNALKNNKTIIHLALSSGLSGSVECAKRVAEKLNKAEKRIYVIDTLCACSGQGLLGMILRDYASKCDNIEQLLDYAENIKNKIHHFFTVDTLTFLANGGRLDSKAAFFGNLLNIKPVMRMSELGKLEVMHKVISRKKSITSISDLVVKTFDEDCNYCFISHANCLQDALLLKEKVERDTTLKPVISNLGPVIGSHSGPGTLAVFFVGKNIR